MRRKSERTAGKKTKASPDKVEKKVDKPKRTRSRRKKQSTSSENDSANDASPVREVAVEAEPEPKPPTTPVKEVNPEESQDQVWQVKTAAASDVGEIQKLKICLTRPPLTPERPEKPERSPRSKRKHSRATSSSDTPSVEASEEKKKSKHRSKRSHRESKDDSEKNLDSQGEDPESAADSQEKGDDEVTQSEDDKKAKDSHVTTSENTISTSDEKKDKKEVESNEIEEKKDKVESSEDPVSGNSQESVAVAEEKAEKPSDADTTAVSPKAETTAVSAPAETQSSAEAVSKDSKTSANTSEETTHTPERRRSMSVDKSEILELHPEDSKIDFDTDKTKSDETNKDEKTSQEDTLVSNKNEDKSPKRKTNSGNDKSNKTGILENSQRTRNISTDSNDDVKKSSSKKEESTDKKRQNSSTEPTGEQKSQDSKSLERSDSIQSNNDDSHLNGQPITPIVVSRKRRWGSRPAKISTQKSITISTDILKEIIPDVKPVEFEEVIQEKKHKKEREVVEKIERPILPKIIIDNSENVERNVEHRRPSNEVDRDHQVKPKEPKEHLASNRKISIIKDNDSIIARPPSPPRHKQSCVLYITNLVRPFTLPQLKNLLQRTGRIVENGFWIDKIKSKCFVIYEDEE